MRKRTRILGIVVLVTGLEVFAMAHYNAILAGNSTGLSNVSNVNAPTMFSIHSVNIAHDSPMLAISDDGQRFAYIDSKSYLRVRDLSTGKEIYKLLLRFTPVYLKWIGDQNLFIGTESPQGNTKDVRVSTIDLSTNAIRLIQVFYGLSLDTTIQQIAYSNYTNDVYILIGHSFQSQLAHFDTNGSISTLDLGGRYVANVGVTQTNNCVYFQDFALGTPNVLQYSGGSVQLIKRNSVLLRVLGNTLYFASLDASGQAKSVNEYQSDRAIKSTKITPPTSASDIYVTSNGQITVRSRSSIAAIQGSGIGSVPTNAHIVETSNALLLVSGTDVQVIQ